MQYPLKHNEFLHFHQLFPCTVPTSGDAHENLHFPLAGIRSEIDSSAGGNAIKILHPRKRRFCNYFCAPSPRAEMHMKIYISHSREYYPAPTIPLAEMLKKYCISASGYFVIILVPVPAWGMHNKLCIPASGNTKRTVHIRFADMQADVCSTASGTARNSVIFNTWFNTKNSFLHLLSIKKLLWNVNFYLNQYFSQTYSHEIVRRNVKLTRENLNLVKSNTLAQSIKTDSKSCADDSKASLVWVKRRTEHDLTLSPNLFFWASSTWCRRPKYFPYVHIYEAA